MPDGENWTVTLTLTVPDSHPSGSLLALRWIVLRMIDAIACAPFRVRVRVARADQGDAT